MNSGGRPLVTVIILTLIQVLLAQAVYKSKQRFDTCLSYIVLLIVAPFPLQSHSEMVSTLNTGRVQCEVL